MSKCPGQDMMFRDPSKVLYNVECSNCKAEVEFWYDDRKRKCANCGEMVRPSLETLMKYHSCASSCKSARECLGDQDYLRLVLTEFRTKPDGKEELEKLLGLVPPGEKDAFGFLKETVEKNLESGFMLDPETDLEPLKKENPHLYDKITDYLKKYVLGE